MFACSGNIATVSLMNKEAFIANRTIVVPTPECYRANKDGFVYTTFPTRFNHELFETDLILQNQKQLPSPNTDYTPRKRNEDGEISRGLRIWFEVSPISVHSTYILTRSKQEIRTSLAEVQSFVKDYPNCWARTLLFYSYSLWFLQLPSMTNLTHNKLKMLRLAFRVGLPLNPPKTTILLYRFSPEWIIACFLSTIRSVKEFLSTNVENVASLKWPLMCSSLCDVQCCQSTLLPTESIIKPLCVSIGQVRPLKGPSVVGFC